MGKRRTFSREFKQEAVQLVSQSGRGISHVGRDLGLHAGMLGRWCREYRNDGPKAFAGQGVARDEELARLKRELARVKRERDFLKDAAVFFARDTPRGRGLFPIRMMCRLLQVSPSGYDASQRRPRSR